MKSKHIPIILLLFFTLLSHPAYGETKTRYFVRLVERTYDDQLWTIHRNNSVDYRSCILIKLSDSLFTDRTKIKMEAGVLRKSGEGFEIPLPGYSLLTDSGTISLYPLNYDSSQSAPLKESSIQLKRWAIEPGDKIHLLIYEDSGYSSIFERYLQIKRHGLVGKASFPLLSVQRGDAHPGTLGAGLSYTGRYIHRDQRLLDKIGWGANLSFLDFEADQKLEIGLGFVITFPDDIFQIGVGKNLTINHDSGYYFLGVDLMGIKDKLGW